MTTEGEVICFELKQVMADTALGQIESPGSYGLWSHGVFLFSQLWLFVKHLFLFCIEDKKK